MPVALLIPIFILLLGAALVLLLDALPRFRFTEIVAALLGSVALAAALHLGTQLPLDGDPSKWNPWSPLAVFGVPLYFRVDSIAWTLMIVLLGVGVLTLLARSGESSEKLVRGESAAALALLAAGTAALTSGSFTTLILAWGATDLMLAIALALHGRAGARRAVLALAAGVFATGAVWAAYLIKEQEGISGFLDLAFFTGRPAWLLQVAVTLRLGLAPLHLWRPVDLDIGFERIGLLLLTPTLLGFNLLIQLPALTDGLPTAFCNVAALTIFVGGGIAWSQTDERRSIIGISMAETGLAVLAVANGGEYAVPVAIAATVAWGSSMAVFALAPGWTGLQTAWVGIPAFLALLSIGGVPPTLGFVTRMVAFSGLEAGLLALLIALVGESLTIAAVLRLWCWSEPRPWPQRRRFQVVYLLILGVVAISLFALALMPELFVGHTADNILPSLSRLQSLGGITGWAGWAFPLITGLTLFLAGEGVRQRLEGAWQRLSYILHLEWLYMALLALTDQVGRFVRGLNSVLEGEGALLWTTVILLMILLYLRGGQP